MRKMVLVCFMVAAARLTRSTPGGTIYASHEDWPAWSLAAMRTSSHPDPQASP